MGDEITSSGLFSVFVVSIFSLVLFPYTIYRLCAGDEGSESTAQPWQKGKKKGKLSVLLSRCTSRGNLLLIGLWVVWCLLILWTQASIKENKPFDPFEILGITREATDKEIKKAYRQLSLKFHPDKNPDPAAGTYFAEFISKAYSALTDETSRANYEKYGHPDGQQAVNVGVALPSFMFAKDSKMAPLMLLALVGVGILLPLVAASWYMLSSNRFSGPNNVMQETLAFYFHSKFCVKESQALVRIPETLVCAMEFIIMPTPAEQTMAIDDLRKSILRVHPDLKDKAVFWKRKASVLKAHMLILAHLERDAVPIPAALLADLKFVLQKSPILLEEMFKIASVPRPPYGYGWLTPAIAVLEMQQCLAQAMSMSDRRPQGRPADATTLLLQLPHFNQDVVKKLKRRKVNSSKELSDLLGSERTDALLSAGLSATAADEVATFLSVLPTVHARAGFEMEGEEEIMEQDIAKCKVRLVITRPTHASSTFEPPAKGKSVSAYTPNFVYPREENWYVMLADPATNSLMGHVRVSLAEAETVGARRPELVEEWAALPAVGSASSTADGKVDASRKDARPVGRAAATATKFIRTYSKRAGTAGTGLDTAAALEEAALPAEEAGQLVEIMFMAPLRSGKYELQLHIMCDSYVGCDRILPLRLRVAPLTKSAQENRQAKEMAKQKQWDSDDEGSTAGEKAGGSTKGDGSGSDGEEEAGSDYDYDSDETGEVITDSESDTDDEVKTTKKISATVETEKASL
mmetsp:Transcript_2646/g.4510  ORF Transcript_2646/g.4510 Transcript_2646/m.4510 type:complete len:749 (+) Transcript_2646:96-2342(+)|eukprot:CAMPEP_0119110848 /NCGR_PEP_ID=MMETSP1180-20130426/32479_1 /TAXON_ID=3052 ORGANISM="Chlamydomonas cf sp, Strain CCMP681" /NCGR_SAMPLE_ID=MMETSP1180 /ASSEMBLY_ACC=CAM_ASM_000741 /LENGTH=748 /DNA_ID=CAMNT_0007097463 /DNA_START=13 /DNA_END=2259 /DNA_ORIENTATION=-